MGPTYLIALHVTPCGPVIELTDTGNGKTITNDAEHVIDDLRARGLLDVAGRVIYLDTSGVWDELVVRDGRFAGFRSIGVRERDDALEWVRKHPADAGCITPAKGGRAPAVQSK